MTSIPDFVTGSFMARHVFIHSEELEEYPYPESCPFNTSRAGRTRAQLISMGMFLDEDSAEVPPGRPGRAVLEQYHLPEYLDALERANRGDFNVEWMFMGLGTADCPIFPGVYDYNALAAGASIAAADEILAGRAKIAFNPSGGLHHAFPAKSGGFCYINDIVLACKRLLAGGRRPLFLDIDVHHCDGVQHAFYDSPEVMVISLHEDGKHLFPGTGRVNDIGEGNGRGYTVNLPLPPGTYDDIYMRAFRSTVLPLIHAFGPDVLVLEVGADTLAGDPLAHLRLTNNVMADVIELLLAFGLPILATGGGGYNVENTVRAWSLVWLALCGRLAGDDALAGMGGVMLETTDWHGGQGLRDRVLIPDDAQKNLVIPEIEEMLQNLRRLVFPLHGITCPD